MIIYSDTSFLVSLFNEEDVNHTAARSMAAKYDQHDFILCEVHQLELPAAMRAAIHRPESPVAWHVARRVINRFDRAMTSKLFQRKEVPMADSVSMVCCLARASASRSSRSFTAALS